MPVQASLEPPDLWIVSTFHGMPAHSYLYRQMNEGRAGYPTRVYEVTVSHDTQIRRHVLPLGIFLLKYYEMSVKKRLFVMQKRITFTRVVVDASFAF
jgi:hypothetical protein